MLASDGWLVGYEFQQYCNLLDETIILSHMFFAGRNFLFSFVTNIHRFTMQGKNWHHFYERSVRNLLSRSKFSLQFMKKITRPSI